MDTMINKARLTKMFPVVVVNGPYAGIEMAMSRNFDVRTDNGVWHHYIRENRQIFVLSLQETHGPQTDNPFRPHPVVEISRQPYNGVL